AVVIGGGVLGVSAARALAALGVRTEIVHQGPYLIERQLDGEAAEVLRERLLALGVETYARNRARAVHGGDRVGAVELANGFRLDCDLVVLACGTRPRTALAYGAGLPVGTGILVDDRLAVAENVSAIGDCAEHRGTVHGLAGPAWEQADALARRLSGADPDARYTGSLPRARLSTGDLEYAAFGAVDESLDPGLDVLRIADATRGSYKKLVLRGDRLVGAILLGDLATVDALAGAFESGAPLGGHPLHLLTRGVPR
ncbi:FAD-dependent oxidoreductase, partial [Kitasatospora sp. NPDC093558]|uniref:NAD(P)/FAD-dependent oxidoreductase n=1 Tax=Kitasatospora sp. NPDC093558 TaxID=3155201 RepID=UPI0034286FEB